MIKIKSYDTAWAQWTISIRGFCLNISETKVLRFLSLLTLPSPLRPRMRQAGYVFFFLKPKSYLVFKFVCDLTLLISIYIEEEHVLYSTITKDILADGAIINLADLGKLCLPCKLMYIELNALFGAFLFDDVFPCIREFLWIISPPKIGWVTSEKDK